MNISLNMNYGFVLVIEAENVKIEEDVEERVYDKLPDGKPDYKSRPLRDISDKSLENLCSILQDLAGYRTREFDSSNLLAELWRTLPEGHKLDLLHHWVADYPNEFTAHSKGTEE